MVVLSVKPWHGQHRPNEARDAVFPSTKILMGEATNSERWSETKDTGTLRDLGNSKKKYKACVFLYSGAFDFCPYFSMTYLHVIDDILLNLTLMFKQQLQGMGASACARKVMGRKGSDGHNPPNCLKWAGP